MYFEGIIFVDDLYCLLDNIMHTSLVEFSDSECIYFVCFSGCEKERKVFTLKLLQVLNYPFSLFWSDFLGVRFASEECTRTEIVFTQKSSHHDRSCPGPTSDLIDAEYIVHGLILDKSCFFPTFLYYLSAPSTLERGTRVRLWWMRKVWTSSERRRANGSGLFIYLKEEIRTVPQRQYSFVLYEQKVKSHLVFSF